MKAISWSSSGHFFIFWITKNKARIPHTSFTRRRDGTRLQRPIVPSKIHKGVDEGYNDRIYEKEIDSAQVIPKSDKAQTFKSRKPEKTAIDDRGRSSIPFES